MVQAQSSVGLHIKFPKIQKDFQQLRYIVFYQNSMTETIMEVSSVSPRVPPGQLRSGMIFLCEIPYPRGQIIV